MSVQDLGRKQAEKEEEKNKTAKEKATARSSSEQGGPIERPKSKGSRMSMASKKKKTTSEFRNGGVVDLGDFKGSF